MAHTEVAPVERDVLTVEEAAARLGVSTKSAYQAINSGEIHHVRVGRRILVPRATFEAWLAGREA